MSKEAEGWLIAVTTAEIRTPLEGFWVFIDVPDGLAGGPKGGRTDASGHFNIKGYYPDPTSGGRHRQLRISVRDPVGRDLRVVSNADVTDDANDSILGLHDVVVDAADALGTWVTLNRGAGATSINPGRVTFLTDQDAFAYGAAMIDRASGQILMSQLSLELPAAFNADASRESPGLIFDFHPPVNEPSRSPGYDLDHPRAAGLGDSRPERMLLDAADRQVQVRILLHEYTIPLFLKVIAGVLLFPFVGTYGISIVRDLVSKLTDADEARRYFGAAGRANIRVQGFKQAVLSAGVMHAKLLAVDGRVLSIGSPFKQAYVDGHEHRIDSWIRGPDGDVPRHDAGFAVTGAAASDLYQTMKLLWDDGAPDDILPDVQRTDPPTGPPPPAPPPSIIDRPEDGACLMQVVRTLSTDRLKKIDAGGEKGILEAYLRGIAGAQDFIYLETQYFTNDAIGHALCERLARAPKLQVIVLLNIAPDTPIYPFKQRRLITRIRREIAKTAGASARFRVFTRWRHEAGPDGPRVMPVYIHAKVGIIDNAWATVGSANLDGLSLDSSLPSDFVRGLVNAVGATSYREQRAIEVNALMADDGDSGAIDVLRRKLWAEHLGYFNADGSLDLAAAPLQAAARPSTGWLTTWSERAAATLQHLKTNPSQPSTGLGCVLPWPDDNTTHKNPRDHLSSLGIGPSAPAAVQGTRKFDFKTGDWLPGSKALMDTD